MIGWPLRRPAARGSSELDRALLRRVAWRTALQSALLVALTFVLCAGLVLLVVTVSAHRAVDAQLASTADHAGDGADPPPGTFSLVLPPEGPAARTPGASLVLPDRAGLAEVRRGKPSVVREVDTDHGEFRVRTQASHTPTGLQVVQAAQSLGPEHAERARLLAALAAAGILALGGAAALGAITGRRSVSGLLDALRRQRTFVADASHELRTPLTVLSTRAQLLRRHIVGLELPEYHRRQLLRDAERLLRDSGRLNEVVEDLLLAAEPVQDRDATVDLGTVADDAVRSAEILAEAADIDLWLDSPANPVHVRGSAAALRRSLLALLDNAIRHTPRGGRVTVAVVRAGTQGIVCVADTGPGIPPQLQPHIFERSNSNSDADDADDADDAHDAHDADDLGPSDGGRRYGLGLALVADTAHRFGGTIQVDSSPAGTRFVLGLPLTRSSSAVPTGVASTV